MAIGSKQVTRHECYNDSSGEVARLAKATFLEALPQLLDELRERGFSVGVEHYVAVNELLIGLAARRAFPLRDELVFGQLLCPLFAKSPLQQEIFSTCFRDWLRRIPTGRDTADEDLVLSHSRLDREIDPETADALRKGRKLLRWRRELGWVLLALVVVMSSVLLFCAKVRTDHKQEPSPSGQPPVVSHEYPDLPKGSSRNPENIAHSNLRPVVWLVTFTTVLSAFLIVVARRRLDLYLTRNVTGECPKLTSIRVLTPQPTLFKSNLVAKVSYDLRRSRLVNEERPDPEGTLRATLGKGGFFTPIFFRRREVPAYLVLIDRRTYADHSAALSEALLDRLAEDGVFLSVYYFDRAARYCFPRSSRGNAARSGAVSLGELVDRHADARLMIFADPMYVLQFGSKYPQGWLQTLAGLQSPGLFARQFDEIALGVHNLLRGFGFSVFPADPSGLKAYADFANGEVDRSAWPRPSRKSASRRIESFESEPTLLGHREPARARVESILAFLRSTLGDTGFVCLCACAVYPEIHWELTVYLTTEICRTQRSVERSEEVLGQLAVLPWFRHARMPDWFRVRLIAALRPQQEKIIRHLIENLLLTALDSSSESRLSLPIASTDRALCSTLVSTLLRGLPRSSPSQKFLENPLGEHVFVTFIESRLSVRLPRAARRLVYTPDLAAYWYPLRLMRRIFAGELGVPMARPLVLTVFALIVILSTVASVTIPEEFLAQAQRLPANVISNMLTALNLVRPSPAPSPPVVQTAPSPAPNPPEVQTAPSAAPSLPEVQSPGQYKVKAGESLFSIAQKVYGSTSVASSILAANKDQLPGWSRWDLGKELPVGITLRMPNVPLSSKKSRAE